MARPLAVGSSGDDVRAQQRRPRDYNIGTWHYRKTPARGQALKRRQDGRSAQVVAICWQVQRRLHRVWQRLDGERAKRRTIVAVAVARELAGFCWALARAD